MFFLKQKSLKNFGYKKEPNGLWTIEVKIENLSQVFEKKDPSPLRVKDLDPSISDYIFSSAEEIGIKKVGQLKILTETTPHISTLAFTASVHNSFEYLAQVTTSKIYRKFQQGLKSLLIGLTCMAFSLSLIFFLENYNSLWAKYIKEGALLFAWVSLWKPFNIFLYEWWPLLDELKIYNKLTTLPIEVMVKPKQTLQKISS